MLITVNSRGIRGHAVLHEQLSTLQNSLLVPASVYPFSPVSGVGRETACWEGTETSIPSCFWKSLCRESHLEEDTAYLHHTNTGLQHTVLICLCYEQKFAYSSL